MRKMYDCGTILRSGREVYRWRSRDHDTRST